MELASRKIYAMGMMQSNQIDLPLDVKNLPKKLEVNKPNGVVNAF